MTRAKAGDSLKGLYFQAATFNCGNDTIGAQSTPTLLKHFAYSGDDVMFLGMQEANIDEALAELDAGCQAITFEKDGDRIPLQIVAPESTFRTNTKYKEKSAGYTILGAISSEKLEEGLQNCIIFNPLKVKSVELLGPDLTAHRGPGLEAGNKGAMMTRCRVTKLDGTSYVVDLINIHASSGDLKNRNADWLLGPGLQHPKKVDSFDDIVIADATVSNYDGNIRNVLDPFIIDPEIRETAPLPSEFQAYDLPRYVLTADNVLHYYDKSGHNHETIALDPLPGKEPLDLKALFVDTKKDPLKKLSEIVLGTEHIPSGFDAMRAEAITPLTAARKLRPQGEATISATLSVDKTHDRKQLAKRIREEGVQSAGCIDGNNMMIPATGHMSSQVIQEPSLQIHPDVGAERDHNGQISKTHCIPWVRATTKNEFIRKRTAIADMLHAAAPELADELSLLEFDEKDEKSKELTEKNKDFLKDVYNTYIVKDGLLDQYVEAVVEGKPLNADTNLAQHHIATARRLIQAEKEAPPSLMGRLSSLARHHSRSPSPDGRSSSNDSQGSDSPVEQRRSPSPEPTPRRPQDIATFHRRSGVPKESSDMVQQPTPSAPPKEHPDRAALAAQFAAQRKSGVPGLFKPPADSTSTNMSSPSTPAPAKSNPGRKAMRLDSEKAAALKARLQDIIEEAPAAASSQTQKPSSDSTPRPGGGTPTS